MELNLNAELRLYVVKIIQIQAYLLNRNRCESVIVNVICIKPIFAPNSGQVVPSHILILQFPPIFYHVLINRFSLFSLYFRADTVQYMHLVNISVNIQNTTYSSPVFLFILTQTVTLLYTSYCTSLNLVEMAYMHKRT